MLVGRALGWPQTAALFDNGGDPIAMKTPQRYPRLLLLILALTARQAAPCAEPSSEWLAGAASAIITPRTNMWMAGYAARKKPSDGTAQDLFAKALALKDTGGTTAIIVTMDLIGVLPSLRQSVESKVRDRYGISDRFLLMNASHTHCGPEYRTRPGREQETATYTALLEENLLAAIGKAISNMAPARLTYAHARCGFAMNRRRNYGLVPGDPNAAKAPNPDGPVDHDVPVLMVEGLQTNLLAVIFGYACHNTTLSAVSMTNNVPRFEFNGDYAGFAQETLEKGRPGLVAMYMAGCGADQNPYPRHFMVPYVAPLEFARHHGRTLAMSVEAAMASHLRQVRGPLRAAMEYITLERPQPQAKAGGKTPPPKQERRYPIHVLRFGEVLSIVALGSEVVVDYSLRLKRELAGKSVVWVAGYSNDYGGYIPSRRILREGGYEAADYTPEIEDHIVSTVHRLHEGLAR